MRFIKIAVMGLIWTGLLWSQVQNIPDFEYVKRVFSQPEYWQELHIRQEINRYLDAFPMEKHSCEMRYFLAVVAETQEEAQTADYLFRAARFLTRDSLLSRRITIHLNRRSAPQPATLKAPQNKRMMALADLYYAWLQAIEQRVGIDNRKEFERDCERFIHHFPGSAHADAVARMLDRLQKRNH